MGSRDLEWGNGVGEYCDINTHPACLEIDLFEANAWAIQSTLHTQLGKGPDGSCNQGAPARRFQCEARRIDLSTTTMPYNPHAA